MVLHGFLFWTRNSLRARILSWCFSLIDFPCTPRCIIVSWTEWALDKCLPNGGANKIQNRKYHKRRHYKSAMKIHRKGRWLLSGYSKVGVGRMIKEKCHRGVNPKAWPWRRLEKGWISEANGGGSTCSPWPKFMPPLPPIVQWSARAWLSEDWGCVGLGLSLDSNSFFSEVSRVLSYIRGLHQLCLSKRFLFSTQAGLASLRRSSI